MTKTFQIPNGYLTLNESKAICPYCERHIPFEEIESKWTDNDKQLIRMKCKCKRYIGITSDIKGDFVVYQLKKPNNEEK